MNPRTIAFILAVLLCTAVSTSQISPIETKSLVDCSAHVVIGTVEAITLSDDASDTIRVAVISPIKGGVNLKTFTLRLRNKGVKNFDPTMKVGDQAIFFLKSVTDGKAELTYWSSIAMLPGGIYTAPK